MAAAYAVACFGKYFDDRGVVLQTENEGVAHFAQKLYRRCGVQGTVISKERPTGPVYEFSVKDPDEVAKMLALFGHTGKEPTLRIRPENFKCQNCMQAFIATAFLCCGTMTDPEKSYNLEFLSTRHYLSQQLEAMLAEHNFHPHRALRKGANTIYIKAADHIEDLLTTIGAAIIWGAAQPLGVMFGSWKGFGLCTALGIVTCYLPYLLYTFGLTGLETGKASILASFEPVVATLVGIFVFHEKLTPLSALGCVCVLSAVVLLNLKRRQKANEIQ